MDDGCGCTVEQPPFEGASQLEYIVCCERIELCHGVNVPACIELCHGVNVPARNSLK